MKIRIPAHELPGFDLSEKQCHIIFPCRANAPVYLNGPITDKFKILIKVD